MIPEGLRYHTEHEWIREENQTAVLGITHFAQDALGDVVYIELPKAGAEVRSGQEIGEVESTKTTSAVYTPVSGKILAVNEALRDKPELVNQDP
jgi:glycine cleavage system H protein